MLPKSQPSPQSALELNRDPIIDTDVLGELRNTKLIAADGGIKDMAYNDGGMGTIIDSGEESYAGDELEDHAMDWIARKIRETYILIRKD